MDVNQVLRMRRNKERLYLSRILATGALLLTWGLFIFFTLLVIQNISETQFKFSVILTICTLLTQWLVVDSIIYFMLSKAMLRRTKAEINYERRHSKPNLTVLTSS